MFTEAKGHWDGEIVNEALLREETSSIKKLTRRQYSRIKKIRKKMGIN